MNIALLWRLYKHQKNIYKSKKAIRHLQQKKLKKLLRFAYENSDYYHRIFEESGITASNLDSIPLSQIPTLNKDLLFQHYDELVTDHRIKQDELKRFSDNATSHSHKYMGRYHTVHSSGSCGVAQYFLYDDRAWNEMLIGIIRGALWGMNIRQIYRLLKEKPRILYIAATDGRYGGAMAVGDGISDLGASEETLDINLPIQEWIDKVTEFSPNIIIGYPSAIKLLAEQMEKAGVNCHLQRIIACGEPLGIGIRSFLEQYFHCDVINFYGASESLALGLEAKKNDGIILFDDLNIIEVENGEMYVTCLYNYAQPLIRYHLTDRLELQNSSPEETHGFTRADLLLCRNEDVMWFSKKDGSKELLHPLSIEGFCVEGLLDYQFIQTSEKSFEIHAETAANAKRGQLAQDIQNLMSPLLAGKALSDIQYTIKFVDSIWMEPKTGKKKLVVTMETLAPKTCTDTKPFMDRKEEFNMRNVINQKQFDEERALYHLINSDIINCVFAGPADGESALKESRDVNIQNCQFSLRYPLWHTKKFEMTHSSMDELTRAAIWYADDGIITDCTLGGIKAVRECSNITLNHCKVNSQEFGWKSRNISLVDTEIISEYLFLDSRDVSLKNVKMKGKYSFQYMENLTIEDCELDTKDAFWHSKNVTVKNSIVKGEYLGWFSQGLTLINCKIIGTQPLCYCENLKLINCTMENTDLSFEYSDVNAEIRGDVLSIKNPKSGQIVADSVGEIIWDDPVMECAGKIVERMPSSDGIKTKVGA